MTRIMPLFFLLFLGCTTYHHEETMDLEGNIIHWETSIKRTWGTSNAEFYVTTAAERGNVGGDGISSNMSTVLGDDAVGKIVMGVTGRTAGQQTVFVPTPAPSIAPAMGGDNTE